MKNVLRNNGLSLVIFALFVLSFIGQVITGLKQYNEELKEETGQQVTISQYLTSGHFFESIVTLLADGRAALSPAGRHRSVYRRNLLAGVSPSLFYRRKLRTRSIWCIFLAFVLDRNAGLCLFTFDGGLAGRAGDRSNLQRCRLSNEKSLFMHFDACDYESASWALDHENKAVGILVSVHRLPCELTTVRRALSISPV